MGPEKERPPQIETKQEITFKLPLLQGTLLSLGPTPDSETFITQRDFAEDEVTASFPLGEEPLDYLKISLKPQDEKAPAPEIYYLPFQAHIGSIIEALSAKVDKLMVPQDTSISVRAQLESCQPIIQIETLARKLANTLFNSQLKPEDQEKIEGLLEKINSYLT